MKDEHNINLEFDTNFMPKLKGITGWLLIPALGLVLTPIISAVMFLNGLNMIKSFTPELINDPRLWLSGLIDISMIIATIVVAVLFFKKRRAAVRAIIGLMVLSILANIVQTFLSVSIFKNIDSSTFMPIIHASIFGLIWIPYFLKSKRVTNTFIE